MACLGLAPLISWVLDMANPFAGTPIIPQDNPELPVIMRRQRMAEQLLQQSQQPLQGQMVSGHYVAPSWTQALAQGVEGYMGRKGIKEADQRMVELAKQLRGQEQADIQKFSELAQGTPARTIQPLTPTDDEGNPMPAAEVAGQAPNLGAAYAALLSSQSPALRQMGMQGTMQAATKKAELAQAEQLRLAANKLWQSVGGDPQKFIQAGGDPALAKQFAEAPMLGKTKGVNVGDVLRNPYTGEIIGSATNPNKPFNPDGSPNAAFQQWELQKAAAGKATTNVNVNTANKPFLTEIGKGVGEAVLGDFNAAKAAQQTLANANQIQQGLSKAIVGPLANQRLGLAQIGDFLGIGGKDNVEKLQNTRNVMQGLARQELAAAGSMKGQGQITESERAILRKAESGQINEMTKAEIETFLSAIRKTANYRIQQHSRNLSKLRQDPNSAGVVQFMELGAEQPGGGGVVDFGSLK